jgi:hypothetical protein
METTIHGHIVSYEFSAELGVRYLIYRDAEEAKVFFDEALNNGHAVFEDHAGTKFKLVHNGGKYELTHI